MYDLLIGLCLLSCSAAAGYIQSVVVVNAETAGDGLRPFSARRRTR
jgi:hypothetical protein